MACIFLLHKIPPVALSLHNLAQTLMKVPVIPPEIASQLFFLTPLSSAAVLPERPVKCSHPVTSFPGVMFLQRLSVIFTMKFRHLSLDYNACSASNSNVICPFHPLPGPSQGSVPFYSGPFGCLPCFLAFAQDAASAEKSTCSPPACDLNLDLAASPGLLCTSPAKASF